MNNDCAVIAISPFNSYYSVANMQKLFAYAQETFKTFKVFVMDYASVYNLIALGYDREKAERKTKKHDSNLKNKIINSLKNIRVDAQILSLSQLLQNEKYIAAYEFYVEKYENDMIFQEDCLDVTRQHLADNGVVDDTAARVAVKYLLLELPIWCNIPEIINEPAVTLVYKDVLPFWQKIYENYKLVDARQKIVVRI